MGKILVVDDEPSIVELARLYLERDGFVVLSAADGEQGLAAFRFHKPDLVVADVMMPKVDGFELLKRIRDESVAPVIMLTARTDDVDKIVGLEIGADDYITKPFNPRELVARVKAVLRRFEAGQGRARSVTCGNLSVDLDGREVAVAGRPVELRTKEFDLLAALVQNAGIVLSRDRLLEKVWGYAYAGETRTVDVHVNQLREKLGGIDAKIQTVWGIGYKIVPPARARPEGA